MSNLIPTPIVDKNGVATIRHMKPQSTKGNGSSSSIPAVAPAVQDRTRTELIGAAFDAVTRPLWTAEEVDRWHLSAAEEYLPDLSTPTLSRIESHPWDLHKASQFCRGLASSWDEPMMNDWLTLSEEFEEGSEVSHRHLNAFDTRVYPDLIPYKKGEEYPEERRDQVIALYQIVEYMKEREDGDVNAYDGVRGVDMWYISNPKLQNFILAPSEYKREDIVDAIRDHGVLDPERLKVLIDFDGKTLSNGAL